jgi:hypothetical protein
MTGACVAAAAMSGQSVTGHSLSGAALGGEAGRGGSVRLSELLQETTVALGRLDVEALGRLAAQAEGLRSGGVPLDPEPVQEVVSGHRVLGSMLAATARNLAVLQRRQAMQHDGQHESEAPGSWLRSHP